MSDLLWEAAWFLVGLVTFQIRGIKHTFTIISTIFSIMSVLSLNLSQFKAILDFIGISVISGVLTSVVYLIGANISRFTQFGKMSPRIIVYLIILTILLYLM
jgi:hypothetical protein